jgi:hypothetical protein
MEVMEEFYPKENSPSTYHVLGWVAYRASLYAVKRRKSVITTANQLRFCSDLVTIPTELSQLLHIETVTVINLVNVFIPYCHVMVCDCRQVLVH